MEDKQTLTVKVEFDFQWTYGIEISKLRADLDTLEKLGATHVDIEAEDNWGSPSVTIEASFCRLETDEEFQRRMDRIKLREEEIKQKELAEFNKIKQKYNL